MPKSTGSRQKTKPLRVKNNAITMQTTKTRLICLLFVLSLLCSGQVVCGQDASAQKNKKAKLEREIALIDKQLKDNESKNANALNSLNLINLKIAGRQELVNECDREIKELSGSISRLQGEINRTQNRLDTLSLYYSKLIKNLYKNRDAKIWYLYIMTSENLGQAFRRIGYMKNLSSNLNAQGQRIKEAKAELERGKDSLMVLRSSAQALRAERAEDLASLKKEKEQAQRIVNQLRRNRTKYQRELAQKRSQVEKLNREIQAIISSAQGGKNKKAVEIDYTLDAEFSKNKGKLPWPAEGVVTESFGQNYHSVFSSVKLPFNNGVTIAVAKDSKARVVFDGVVKQIAMMAGYNKCVLVQHGKYFTLYCKLKEVNVKAGDKVKTGDIVGTVDTIDNMTLLHFQLWKNTDVQNPENWLRPQ